MRKRTLVVLTAAVAMLAVLAGVGVLIFNAKQDVKNAAMRRFDERAQISAALTRSLFSSQAAVSTSNLARQLGGTPAQLRHRLAADLAKGNKHPSPSNTPYLAVFDADNHLLAASGTLPADLTSVRAVGGQTSVTDVQQSAAGPVLGLVVPFPVRGGERVLVNGLSLTMMRALLDAYLAGLPNPDGASLHLLDSRGRLLAQTLPARNDRAKPGTAMASASVPVPETPWTLRLSAPRARVLAGTSRDPWLPWLLLALVGAAGIAGLFLYQRLQSAAARERRAYAALNESRQQLTTLVDALEEAVIAHHPDGRIELLNPAAKRLLHTYVDVVDQLPAGWSRLHEDGTVASEDEHPARIAFATGVPQQQRIGFQRPDGSRTWTEVRARPLIRPGEHEPYLVVTTATDVTNRQEHTQQLAKLADHDPLTNLWNRRRFDQELSAQLARCHRLGETAALLIFDVDGFKQVNDRFGHQRGDAVLQTIATTLLARLRNTDRAARIGGDEFAVMLVGAEPEEARRLAAELAGDLTDAARHEAEGVPVSLSVGVAILDRETADVTAVIGDADQDMYAAKASRQPEANETLPRQRADDLAAAIDGAADHFSAGLDGISTLPWV